jgi:DMSO/TMAO reductase YedYZ molybdopterin-dependent catalytic subunit
MNTRVSRTDVLFALLAGITGVAGSFAVAGYTRQFVVAPIDALVVRLTPGPVVAFVIETVGDQGHLLHIALSVGIAAGLFGGAALIGIVAAERIRRPLVGAGAGGALAGVLAWGVAAGTTAEPALAVAAGVPVALLTVVGAAPGAAAGHDSSRRRAMASAVGVFGFASVAGSIGRQQSKDDAGPDAADVVPSPAVQERLRRADEQSLDITGDDLPGLVSSIGNFYNVDINEFDPDVPADGWEMSITGEVGSDVAVTYAELTEMPVEHRYVTLRCVGEALNGRKMDTAVWTGTPIGPLLDAADPEGECGCVMLHAEDGYSVQFPVEALEDGLLAWEMNGQPLPKSHGHPVRVLVPGHWGETNVKWLDEIELLEAEADGYWERRGWHGTGPVNTVAKLWDTTELGDGRVEVAGHAYAGTRGVDRVEVSLDDGDSWIAADLSEPLPGDDVWRQWRHAFDPDGVDDVVVRAVDGEGTVQTAEATDSFPSGATGWVRQSIDR